MATNVVMPQMGESVAEGTIVRWIKKVGDQIDRDEPLLEISTDKVDAEIPAPAGGIVAEIRAKEGETVPVGSVVAVIAQPDEVAATPKAAPAAAPAPPATPSIAHAAAAPSAPSQQPAQAAPSMDEVIRQRSSPLVRRMAKEHGVDISQIRGTGISGRVTKRDMLEHLGAGAPAAAAAGSQPAAERVEPLSVMRRRIAEHMVASRRTSAHVHTVFEVNFHRVAKAREARKAEFEQAGTKLTYLAFIAKAVAAALRAVPMINASLDGDHVVYHDDVNLGIAVALEWGLIVPVIRKADRLDLLETSRAIADLAGRARGKQLKPDEVAGGTFTITNPGALGAQFGMPIINQPQVAILDVGAIEKRAVVIDDTIAIRPMAYLTLGFDHRLIDGAVADDFLARVKKTLESWE